MNSNLLTWAIVIHLVCDWLLQNHWMATYKSDLRHPAAWVHSGIHTIGLMLVFSPVVALIIGLTHILIDTRKPLAWWRRVFQQTREGEVALHVALWGDQVLHILVLAIAVLIMELTK